MEGIKHPLDEGYIEPEYRDKENIESNEQVQFIHIPRLSQNQFNKLANALMDVPEKVFWYHKSSELKEDEGGFKDSAPRYAIQLLDMKGFWLATLNDNAKDLVLLTLAKQDIKHIEVKEGGRDEMTSEFEEDVLQNQQEALERTKLKGQWPGSPRH